MIAQLNRNNCSSVNSNYNLLFVSQSVHVSVCVSTSVSAGKSIRSDEFKVIIGNCIQFSTIQTFGPETSSLDFEPSWRLKT